MHVQNKSTASSSSSAAPAPSAERYNPTEPLHFPPPHMFYPPQLSTTNNTSTVTSPEAGASPTGQPQPSPETFPAWMFGEGWLDSQLSLPFVGEEGAQGQMRPQLPPMMGYPPGAGGMGLMMPPWPMMPPHHFGGPGAGGGPWEGWHG